MYHSITFMNIDDTTKRINTYEDWHLIPSSRPLIVPPKVQTKYVDIPGADGSLDLTDYLAGRPTFSNREGTMEFMVLNDYNIEGYHYNWVYLYSDIMKYLHGWQKIMILEDDPYHYYKGRFSVDSWAVDQHNSKITIGYKLWPYKLVSHYILPDDLEIGGYNVSDTSAPLNQDVRSGPVLDNATSGCVRQKTSAYPRSISEGVKISFASNNSGDSLKMYKCGLSQGHRLWTLFTTIDAGSSYTIPENQGGFFRFSIYSSSITGGSYATFSSTAASVKFEYEATEVL